MARIKLVNLHRRYGDTPALRGIDLCIEDGELLALLGPSGCGKTTTLHLLAGFVRPDEGEIWSDERLISSPRGVVPPERRNVGMVFQGYALWPHLTVAQNVAFGLEVRHRPRGTITREVDWALGLVDLRGYGGRYPHELSGGQQQRVALARAIVVRPDTLLLDEPLSNLDANLREQMRFEIRRVHQETGITMVYVTHDQAEAMVIADQVAVMNAGRIEQIGPPREIYECPQSRFVAGFIGNSNCLPCDIVAPGVVRCGELTLRTGQAEPPVRPPAAEAKPVVPPTGEVEPARVAGAATLCIRPGALRVSVADGSAPALGPNTVHGRVVQLAYLGEYHDLRIALSGGQQVRALAPAREAYAPGAEVLVHFPPGECRVVTS